MKTFEVFSTAGQAVETIKADSAHVVSDRLEFRNVEVDQTSVIAAFNYWTWFKVVEPSESGDK